MIIRETTCKTALIRSALPNLDYALNPYKGCEHACIYCYAPSVLKYGGEEKWGDFVEVRKNMPKILSKELKSKRKEPGIVGIGTVTDPYQPVEKRYEVTMNCLRVLLDRDFPVSIQTKSSLVLRDINILKRFKRCEVGFTITSIDEHIREKYEPKSSSFDEKVSAIRKLSKNGIKTWIFLGPIMPYITDRQGELEKLISKIPPDISYIIIDKLRLKKGLWKNIELFLSAYNPELIPIYKDLLYSKNDYFLEVKSEMVNLCRAYNINCKVLF